MVFNFFQNLPFLKYSTVLEKKFKALTVKLNSITRKILECNMESYKANIFEICIVSLFFQNFEKK